MKISNNKPDIFVLGKANKKITLIDVGVTSIDNLYTVKNEKKRIYDLLVNELGLWLI